MRRRNLKKLAYVYLSINRLFVRLGSPLRRWRQWAYLIWAFQRGGSVHGHQKSLASHQDTQVPPWQDTVTRGSMAVILFSLLHLKKKKKEREINCSTTFRGHKKVEKSRRGVSFSWRLQSACSSGSISNNRSTGERRLAAPFIFFICILFFPSLTQDLCFQDVRGNNC